MGIVISEDDVTTEALMQLFHRAFLRAQLDEDGDVYISEGLDFPIWVSVDREQRVLRLFTFMDTDEDDVRFTQAGANHLNATAMPTFYVRCDRKGRLCSKHFMTF